MNKYNTVIFDMDGTVMNTLVDLLDSTNYILDKYNYPNVILEDIGAYMGNGLEKYFEKCFPNGSKNENYTEAVSLFLEYYADHCQVKTAPYDGILDLMAELQKRNYKMAIVSNKTHGPLQVINNKFFSEYIEFAIGDEPSRNRKPAPDGVEKALELLGSAKETSVYIGDTEVDRATAKNAGLDCVLVSWGFRDIEFLKTLEANAIIDKPLALLDFLA